MRGSERQRRFRRLRTEDNYSVLLILFRPWLFEWSIRYKIQVSSSFLRIHCRRDVQTGLPPSDLEGCFLATGWSRGAEACSRDCPERRKRFLRAFCHSESHGFNTLFCKSLFGVRDGCQPVSSILNAPGSESQSLSNNRFRIDHASPHKIDCYQYGHEWSPHYGNGYWTSFIRSVQGGIGNSL
jgi:hypothetical protein